jgi:hypothetical protein
MTNLLPLSEALLRKVKMKEDGDIRVTRLMLWFLGDFGGFRRIRKLLEEKLGVDTRGKRIKFRDYDWTERLYNFE